MKKNRSTISRKFITLISILFSILILVTAISFNIILKKNAVALKDTIIKGSQDLALQETGLVTSLLTIRSIRSVRQLQTFLENRKNLGEKFLNILVYRKTSDENYFKVLSIIQHNTTIPLSIKINSVVKEAKNVNYIQKARFGPTIDTSIHSHKGQSWLNVYTPYMIKNKKYILHFMFSVNDLHLALDNYYTNIKHIQYVIIIITSILVLSVMILLIVLNYNISYLLKNLSAFMQQAAQGNHDINLNVVNDQELNELAHSFNSLVEELKGKSETISEPYSNIFKTGVAFLKENKLIESIAIFKTLTIIKEEGFGNFFNLGVAYAKNKNYNEAAKMFETALKADPEHTVALKYLEKTKKLLEKDNE